MSTGHKHRVIRLQRGSWGLRLLQTHLVETTDSNRARRSRWVWGRITPDEPDYPPELRPWDVYVLTPLSILHTLCGLTVAVDEPR